MHGLICAHIIASFPAVYDISKVDEAAKTIRSWARVSKSSYRTINGEKFTHNLITSLFDRFCHPGYYKEAGVAAQLRTRGAGQWLCKLREAHADINSDTRNYFIGACGDGDNQIVSFMLATNPSIVDEVYYECNGLMQAAFLGHLTTVNKLFAARANINFQSLPGKITPLMQACLREHYYDNSAVIHRLLEAGADVSLQDSHGRDASTYLPKNHPLLTYLKKAEAQSSTQNG